MRIEGFDAVLRPRSMAEAADLGVALVQQHRASLWRSFVPLYAAVVLLAFATVEIKPWLPWVLLFWLKPWLDRALLFVLSRAVFAQETRWADLWRERGNVLWRGLFWTLTWRRLSPWRSYTQPVVQLEGQRGKGLRQRRAQILRYKRAAASGMTLMFANAEFALVVGAMSLVVWFAPQGLQESAFHLFGDDDAIVQIGTTVIYALVVLMLEPFYVAAGFAMYLNRRVELEAWDVEQEFRHAFAG